METMRTDHAYMVYQKQQHIPRGIAEISATGKDLKDAGIFSICSHLTLLFDWYRREVLKGNSDYHKLNQVVSSFEADEPDVVSLLEQKISYHGP